MVRIDSQNSHQDCQNSNRNVRIRIFPSMVTRHSNYIQGTLENITKHFLIFGRHSNNIFQPNIYVHLYSLDLLGPQILFGPMTQIVSLIYILLYFHINAILMSFDTTEINFDQRTLKAHTEKYD